MRLVFIVGLSLLASLFTPGVVVAARFAPPPEPTAPKVMKVDFRGNTFVMIDTQKNLPTTKAPVGITAWEGNDEVEWKASRGTVLKNWPVVYQQEKRIKLEAQFEIESATRKFLEGSIEGSVTFTGELTLSGSALTFTKVLTNAEAKAQAEKNKTFLTTGVIESSRTIPAGVHVYAGTPIRWKWEGTETGGIRFNQSLGESKHNILTQYKTLSQRLREREDIYFTLLYLATKSIEKRSATPTEAEALEGVWNVFAGRTVNPVEYNLATGAITVLATVLKYWDNVVAGTLEEEIRAGGTTCPAETVKALLEDKTGGRCGGWADTLAFTLGYEGIRSRTEELRTNFTECEVNDACAFLVNNWEFRNPGVGRFPYSTRNVIDLEGLPGQGTTNPDAAFFNHYFVRIQNKIYDPSYATTATGTTREESLKKYQEASMAGYCKVGRVIECQSEGRTELKLKETDIDEF